MAVVAPDEHRLPVRVSGRVILLDAMGFVLLLSHRTEAADRQPVWATPGGQRQGEETSAQAARRELAEECSVTVSLSPTQAPDYCESRRVLLKGITYHQLDQFFSSPGVRPAARHAGVTPSAGGFERARLLLGIGVGSARLGVSLRAVGVAGPDRTRDRRGLVSRVPPTLRFERQAWREGAGLLAAIDEVGRGALAGPVSVGVVLLHPDTKPAPAGVADSKLLTPLARERLVPRIRRWALDCSVGHASADEIDAIGIIAALRLAAERAVSALSTRPDWILLDGNHDYLTPRPDIPLFELMSDDSEGVIGGVLGTSSLDVAGGSLDVAGGSLDVAGGSLDEAGAAGGRDFAARAELAPSAERWRCDVPVRTLIKGDMRCSSIAAASVLAKTERDGMLVELAKTHPQYGFEDNKAYASPQHIAALAEHGPSTVHRRSWNLPGLIRGDVLIGDDGEMIDGVLT
jgi:ribonuclease HII